LAAALKPALVFIGFMGAGKSRAAREAAAALGVPANDADALLEAKLGEPISEVFARDGEAAFRAVEEELVGQLLETADGGVVALGGGALGSERVRAALQRHVVALLDVDVDTAWERAGASGRTLARERGAFASLHAARDPVYQAAADAVLPATGRGTVARALGALLAIPHGHRLLWATSASGDYPVWVGPLDRAPWPSDGRRVVISDETVAALHGGRVPDAAGLVEVPPGEEHKTLATAERVWHALVAQGTTRADLVVALGGGVVGDLAGFCAATYQRGVGVVQVPTTLVA
jgi:shikimate kinase/3-dehydroquinate synthase